MINGKFFSITISAKSTVFAPSVLPTGITYLCGQLENSDTNYLHWQLYAIAEKKQRISFISKIFRSAHIEFTRSGAIKDYVSKKRTSIDDTYFAIGDPPTFVGKQRGYDWDAIRNAAIVGDLSSIPSQPFICYYNSLNNIAKDHLKPSCCEKTVHVYWGTTGSGKSRRAWDEATFDAYPKDPNTKYWDGYSGQSNVVIDEFRGKIDISHMLRWLDRYPVLVEKKFGAISLKATNIWITSNLHPSKWYCDLDSETISALVRRLNIIEFK